MIVLIKPVEKYEERLKLTEKKSKMGHFMPKSRLNTSLIFKVTLWVLYIS